MNARLVLPVFVLSYVWTEGVSRPPVLDLELSTGAVLEVRWALEYQCRELFLFTDATSFESAVAVTGDQTGLTEDELWKWVDLVQSATARWECES